VIPALALYGVVGLLLVLCGSRLGRGAFLVGAIPAAVSTAWVCIHLGEVVGGRTLVASAAWVSGLGLSLDVRLDGLAATMTLIVAGIGVLVMVYAA
jgi:multicomponent Na+:H+ antiporter subunit A